MKVNFYMIKNGMENCYNEDGNKIYELKSGTGKIKKY